MRLEFVEVEAQEDSQMKILLVSLQTTWSLICFAALNLKCVCMETRIISSTLMSMIGPEYSWSLLFNFESVKKIIELK